MRAFLLALVLLFAQAAHAQNAGPFGMKEIPIQGGDIKEKWSAVLKASANDRQSPELLAFSKQFTGLTGRTLVGHVNRAVNQLLRPVEDQAQWGRADHWSPALETLATKKADCEDYAILKYAVLRLFLPDSSLKPVIGHDSMRGKDHMLLLVRVDRQWLALNSGTHALVADVHLLPRKFRPMYSLTEQGTFLLVPAPAQSLNDILKARS